MQLWPSLKIILQYTQENNNGFELFFDGFHTHRDDGKTRTDTDCESFQKLLTDVYSGKINCVIIKNRSQISYNYTDAGNLIENLFCSVQHSLYQSGRRYGQLPQPG